jgi:polyhydroxyalkanoate synthesis repressor PhaR
MLIIRRYANRKLYLTDTSKYINLSDILKLTESGTLFQVIDMKTRKDLTELIILRAKFKQQLDDAKEGAEHV